MRYCQAIHISPFSELTRMIGTSCPWALPFAENMFLRMTKEGKVCSQGIPGTGVLVPKMPGSHSWPMPLSTPQTVP